MTPLLTQRLIIGFLIIYFLAGAAVYRRTPTDEIYPFFSWSLFRDVPQRTKLIETIQITGVGGKKLEKPLLYKDARTLLEIANGDNTNYLFSELARTYKLHDAEGMRAARKRIEKGMPPKTTYDLLEMDVDTIAYWKSGSVIQTRTLHSFTSGEL